MTDSLLVLRKLATLREHIERARRRRPAELEELRRDVDRQDALGMSVLVALQEAIDVAFHVAADERWGISSSYAESFELLVQHGVIDAELGRELSRAVGLRNRLAHGYATVDVERLWSELPSGLDSLERFAAALAAFIGRQPSGA